MRKNLLEKVIVVIALVAVLGPILWVIRVALKPESDYIGAPAELGGGWTFDNLVTVWTAGGMAGAVLHSTIVVAIGSVVAITLATFTGYALARYRFRGKLAVIAMSTGAMFLPAAALVIPLFELMQSLGMLDSLIWLGVVYGVIFSAWSTVFLRSYFKQLPEEVYEAGEMDGANPWQQFFLIALPMARPALATAFLLTCFLQWSELLLGLLLLPSGDTPTVAMSIAQFSSQFRTGGPLTAAAMLVGTVPVLILFIFGQKWLQAGAMAGAVKD